MRRRTVLSRSVPLIIGLFAVVLWCVWAWYVGHRFPDGTKIPEEVQQAAAVRGQFGDMFGGINALFTALILAGAIYTVWLQQKEIESIQQQQEVSKQENARTALLLAYSALVNAKSSSMQSRYQFMKDIQPHLQKLDPKDERSGALGFMLFAHGEKVGKALTDLESLSEELTALIEAIRDKSEDPQRSAPDDQEPGTGFQYDPPLS